jgi:hypothetical protein
VLVLLHAQSYNLSGSNLTGAPGVISVTAPTHYEVSSDNTNYANSITINYTSSTLSSTPVFVRLKSGLAVGTYNAEVVVNSGGGATLVNVTCNGSVSAVSSTCDSESFTNIPTASSSSYSNRTWTGDDGNSWSATNARTDQTLTGKAICFKGNLLTPTTSGGVGSITVTTKFPFADGTYDMPVSVNGVQVGIVPVSTATATITLTGINVAGNVQIQFSSNGTKRPVIDDLSWTCYSAPSAAPQIQSVAFANGNYKIDDDINITITADGTGYTAGAITVNGRAVTGFTDNNNNTYAAIYTVVEGDNDISTAALLPVSVVLMNGAQGNSPYTNAATGNISIDANRPVISSVQRISNTQIKVLMNENIDSLSATQTNDGGFLVSDSLTPVVTFDVLNTQRLAAPQEIMLTAEDFSASAMTGLLINYTSGLNGLITDVAGNTMNSLPNAMAISAWESVFVFPNKPSPLHEITVFPNPCVGSFSVRMNAQTRKG